VQQSLDAFEIYKKSEFQTLLQQKKAAEEAAAAALNVAAQEETKDKD
jgi:hypothetical protein